MQFVNPLTAYSNVREEVQLVALHILRNLGWGGVFPIYYNITWGGVFRDPQIVLRNI